MSMPCNILIADDDPEDLELIEEAILNVDPEAELHKFSNGLTAMEYLNGIPDASLPQLIVLDYNMPEQNGAWLLSSMQIKGRYNLIPKIVLSTSNAPLHINECMNNGATEYIVKPDNMQELQALGKRLLSLCRKN
jgi:CheY-like chemotaxis protein